MLKKALSGNQEELEKIILLYMPLINKYSYINGKIDEDLRQYIILRILNTIKKFKI